MDRISRRSFLKQSALSAVALGTVPVAGRGGPLYVLPGRDLVFRPYPHPQMPAMAFAYLADEQEDPFKSSVRVDRDGIVVPRDIGSGKFSVNARWYVRDFGYVWLSADNGGRFYTSDDAVPDKILNLEFARSRVTRNASVRARYEKEGTVFSPEVIHLFDASEELFEDAAKRRQDPARCVALADRALAHALRAGERIELEKARSDIARRRRTDDVYFGCETRQYVWAKSEEFTKRFVELFNFATITHYVWDTWYPLFEPREGEYQWGIKDDIVRWLSHYDITIQGRPLFWFHPTVTPEWLKRKTFDEVKQYVERHAHALVSHYGEKIRQWEIVNEFHDWANIHNLSEAQITEIVRLACTAAREADPGVVRILNNCCPWAEYAARGRMARMDATRPLRSPRRFLQDLADAGVEYDVLGIQIYFPQRDLSDIARLLERLAAFGKPIYITEIGASSKLTAPAPSGAVNAPQEEPYAWHRHWDEELQADWLEQVYTLYYSKPYIKAINWYDFSDFRPFIVNGGLVREDASPKQSFHRLAALLNDWKMLPAKK
ncbi:MAG: endo-1,4-beta-xylanase [Bacteroidota bacterium]